MDRLEYRPDIQHTPDKHDSVSVIPDQTEQEVVKQYHSVRTEQVWGQLTDLVQHVDDLLSTIDERMQDHITQIDDEAVWDILERVKAQYGDNTPEHHMSFSLYKEIYNNQDYESNLVKQSYEEAHSQLDGSLEVETYPILAGVYNEINETSRLMKDTVLNFIDNGFNGHTSDDTITDSISDVVNEYENGRHQLAISLSESVKPDTNDEIDAATEEQLQYELDQDKTSYELKNLIQNRIDMLQTSAHNADHLLHEGADLHNSTEDITKHLGNTHNFQDQITRINKLCDFICSQKASECLRQREKIENVTIPRNATDGILTAMSHYRQKTASPAVRWMMHLDKPLDVDGDQADTEGHTPIHEIADILSEAVEYSQGSYESAISGSYGLAKTCMNARRQYMKTLQDKEKAKSLYRITQELSDKAQAFTSHEAYQEWLDSIGRGEQG